MKYLAIVRSIAAIKEKQYCHATVLIVTNGNYSCKVKSVNCYQGLVSGLKVKHCNGKMKNKIENLLKWSHAIRISAFLGVTVLIPSQKCDSRFYKSDQ